MPLVSVITTVKNCDRYIEQSIESIINQDFTDFEFIIANDGSVDGTAGKVRAYKDDRIVFLDSTINMRIPKRRNECILAAKGKYIAIHDGDDVSLPHRLGSQTAFLEAQSDVFCVGGHAVKIDIDGSQIGYMTYPPETHDQIITYIEKPYCNPIIDPSSMFRREEMIELGLYTTTKALYTIPDFELWCRALLAGKRFYNLQDNLIQYRVNPCGMTATHKFEMLKAHSTVWHNLMKGLKDD